MPDVVGVEEKKDDEQSEQQSQIISLDADLRVYPGVKPELAGADITTQLTIGDLHGNALKLVYFLIAAGVMQLDEEQYNELVEIYYREGGGVNQHSLHNNLRIL